MARLPIQNPETATGSNQEIFASLKKALGTVPNMMKVMGNSPAVLKGYASLSGALGAGALAAPIREQIALLAAETNACNYCLSAHSALGKMAGLKPDQIAAARDGSASDPKAAAALAFARSVIETKGGVEAGDVEAARGAGLSDAELAEVVGAVAINVFTNYFNRAFATEIDFPVVESRQTVGAR
ncbi:MAG: carboxymuconolactone decarboxylase family protein [Phycisphaerales bacterium]|nr:carboxymuconolactone decarboxylase family protein [Phycisphaerales bacterium]MCB9841209.1 carboxymuconolactone decarboxylase family protein [Phycisphaeraceae bacterium]